MEEQKGRRNCLFSDLYVFGAKKKGKKERSNRQRFAAKEVANDMFMDQDNEELEDSDDGSDINFINNSAYSGKTPKVNSSNSLITLTEHLKLTWTRGSNSACMTHRSEKCLYRETVRTADL